MRRPLAALGTAAFFAVAPGVVGGVVPWWITGWHMRGPAWWGPLRILGALLVAAGAAVLIDAFVRFAREGAGTPAPIAPTERLVVGGLYRYVRNPMYVALLAVLGGQALLLAQPRLLTYAAGVAVVVVAFVRLYEEPTLSRRFGADYEAYRREVPRWWPRLTAARPPAS